MAAARGYDEGNRAAAFVRGEAKVNKQQMGGDPAHAKGNMKRKNENSVGMLKLVLAGCLAIVSASAGAGPTNSWNDWQFKKVLFVFSNAPVVSLNGHALEQFSTNLFDDQTKIYLYAEADGKVFGVGNTSLQTSNREALFNIGVKGSLSTKGSNPNLAFTLRGQGPGTVGARSGPAKLDAKFVQTQFITVSPGLFEEHYSEGNITGTVKFSGGSVLRFEDIIRIRLDDVAGLGQAYMIFDITDNGIALHGHSHGTNNCFGKYEGHPVELVANGSYKARTGGLVIRTHGVGDADEGTVKFKISGQLESAPPGEHIDINNVIATGKSFGQRATWRGIGTAVQATP